MSGWTIALIVVVALVAAAVVPHEVRLYRRSRQRRGGMLELDTREARAALADPDDWFDVADEVALIPDGVFKAADRIFVDSPPRLTPPARLPYTHSYDPDRRQWFITTELQRCNPARKIHYHGGGDRCQCGELPNVRTRDDAA